MGSHSKPHMEVSRTERVIVVDTEPVCGDGGDGGDGGPAGGGGGDGVPVACEFNKVQYSILLVQCYRVDKSKARGHVIHTQDVCMRICGACRLFPQRPSCRHDHLEVIDSLSLSQHVESAKL